MNASRPTAHGEPDADYPPTPGMMVIGPGKVGRLLLWLARAQSLPIHAVLSRTPAEALTTLAALQLAEGQVRNLETAAAPATVPLLVALSVPEDALPSVVATLTEQPPPAETVTVFHCAGPLDSSVLTPLRTAWRAAGCAVSVGSWHPLRSVVDARAAAESFAGTTCAIEGDAEAVATLLAFTGRVRGNPLSLPTDAKAAYHAAAVMASNYLVALADQATALLGKAELPPDAALDLLLPLMRGTLQNLETKGLPTALTGPIERGDATTVRLHLEALRESPALPQTLYRQLGLAALDVAVRKGLPKDRAEAVRNLLNEPLD